MSDVLHVVGPSVVDPSVSGSYAAGDATCLLYDVSGRLYGVSLCFVSDGRLVETTDARKGTGRFETFRSAPELARVRVPPQEVVRTVRLLDRRAAVTLAAATAINHVRTCVDATRTAAVAPRRKVAKATGFAARRCGEDAANLAELARSTRESPFTGPGLDETLADAERVVAAAARATGVASRQFFGQLRRRRVVVAAYRAARRDAATPLAALKATRRAVAPGR